MQRRWVMEKNDRNNMILLSLYLIVAIWSAWEPYGQLVWLMQSVAAHIVVLVLIITYRRFRFTTFIYAVVLIHMTVILIGAHYTYSRNPLFELIKVQLDLSRNYYDRVGHFFQGFGPALMAREVLIRGKHVRQGRMLSFIVVSMCLGMSAFYELLELGTSYVLGLPVEVVMGMQGSAWDSQWDMLMALIGSITALALFTRIHDRKIRAKNEYVNSERKKT
jgi:putative membrane protein